MHLCDAVLVFKEVIFRRETIGVLQNEAQMGWEFVGGIVSDYVIVGSSRGEKMCRRGELGGWRARGHMGRRRCTW